MPAGLYNAFPFTPRGLIAIFTGVLSRIPIGWRICDGNNGTPNLLDKFVKSITIATEEPGSTGGAATHGHGNVSHGHGNPGHIHNTNGPSATTNTTNTGTGASAATGTHTHQSYSNSDDLASNSFTVSSGVDHRPPWFQVAFIMKV